MELAEEVFNFVPFFQSLGHVIEGHSQVTDFIFHFDEASGFYVELAFGNQLYKFSQLFNGAGKGHREKKN